MAKTVDLRTYLLLERSFVRRLQRSWQKQSAPTYAKIAQACNDHKWDEARRLVGDLDMTEVGTENREWISYMLLSCAVFGANSVARGKPSFVGVGSFDTFLKQVTNNMLQYLEYRGTTQVQAEALQSIAEDEAKTKAAQLKVAFDPNQPRDDQGRWTASAVGQALIKAGRITTDPNNTFFLLHDGTRVTAAGYNSHAKLAAAAGYNDLNKVIESGVVRYIPGVGIEANHLTETQAKIVVDDWKANFAGPHGWNAMQVDLIGRDDRLVLSTKERSHRFDRLSVDALLNFVNGVRKWDEAKHPRKAKGGPKGGEFARSTTIEASYDGYQHTLTMTTPDGQVVGSAKLRKLANSHVVEFDILWIDPSARGKGAGEHLYRAAADKAKALGGTSLLGDVTSAGILKLGIKVLGQPEHVSDAVELVTVEDAMKRLEPLAPENAQGIIDTSNYLAVRWPLTKKKYAVKSEFVCKWDESQHPRDDQGRWTADAVGQAKALTKVAWDPQQPRDEDGRWVDTASIQTERPMVLAKGAAAIIGHYAAGRMPLDADKVAVLEQVIQSGKTLPPLVMSPEGILRDGHHRLQAYRNRGVKMVRVVDEVLKYDPHQLRDEQGRWAKGGKAGALVTDTGNTFLHGTAQGFLEDILLNGLRGERAGLIHPTDLKGKTLALPGHVYMTTDLEEAKAYAESAGVSDEFFNKHKETVLNPVYMHGYPRIERYQPSYESGTEIGGRLPCVITIELPPSVVKKLRKDRRSDILTPSPYAPGGGRRKLSDFARSYKGDIKPEWIKSISYLTRDLATGKEEWHTIDAKDYHAPGPQTPPYLPQPPGWEVSPEWSEYLKTASEGTVFYIPLKIPVQSIAGKFEESQHPREAAGTSEGGQFTESGHGVPTSDPVLAAQATAGIAAVEALLPKAIKEADYTSDAQPKHWDDVSDVTQDKIEQKYLEDEYDNVGDPDTSLLEEEERKNLQENNQSILDASVKDTLEALESRFPDTERALPIETEGTTAALLEGQFDLKKTLDPDTFDYVDGEDDGGPIALDLEALRFKTGEPLTPEEQRLVQEKWNYIYRENFSNELQTHYESDEFLEKVGEARQEAVQQNWNELSGAERLQLLSDYGFSVEVQHDPPDHWTTGIETDDDSGEDYAKTHAIANKLTELRTQQLREERGLLRSDFPPTYTIKDTTTSSGTPSFVILDEHGNRVGGSNTLEQAQRNAEAWAEGQANLAADVTTTHLINSVWEAWKTKSSSGLGLSLQLAAARELGGVHRMTPEEERKAEEDAQQYGGIATLQAYVRAQWEVTQMVMQKAGEDKVSVYRAVMLPGEQVDQTLQKVVDKFGKAIPPPSNIQPVKRVMGGEINPEYITFDFNGEQLQVRKQRIFTSILDQHPNPQSWSEVSPAMKDQLLAQWKADTLASLKETPEANVSEARAEELSVKMWAKLGGSGRFSILLSYLDQGKIKLPPPPEPVYESDTAAINRRLGEYVITKGGLFTQLPELSLKRAGAQSTTGTRSVANDWGGVGNLPEHPTRVVIRLEVPPTSVLSIPVYGENIQEEHETVVVGARDKWFWDAWRGEAPDFSSQSIMTSIHKADTKPLVVDLQAEDRGKPHWMTGVDWEKAVKWEESQHPRDPKGTAEGGQFTRVAMTSQRTEGDPGHQSNAEVFRHMQEFHAQLAALPGVSAVSVKPGVGGWEGGSESMWQIYYRGNGAARKLVASTAKAFNQDAVLVLTKCGVGQDCQPAVELSFEGGITPETRAHVHQVLVANGIGGWTWMKRNGKTLLRMVSVPQWGGNAKTHQQATAAVSRQLREDGLKNHRRLQRVAVSVMEREGAHSYDTVIGS